MAGVDDAARVAGILPTLAPGERDCPTCQGRGWVVAPWHVLHLCPKCLGERKLSSDPLPTDRERGE